MKARIVERTAPDGRKEYVMSPESICEKCGGPNVTWFAPNDLWNKYSNGYGILCPVCFAQMTEDAGFIPTAWKIEPESLPQPKEEK